MDVRFKIVQTLVFVFALNADLLKKAAMLVPEALTIKDPETKEPIFNVVYKGIGDGSLSTYGATFGAPAVNGEAMIKIEIPACVRKEDRKQWVEDNYGKALYNLNKVSAQIKSALQERGEVLAPIMEAGTVED